MLARKRIRRNKGKFKEKWSLSRLLLDSLFYSISQRIKLKRKYILKVFYLASIKSPLRSSSSLKSDFSPWFRQVDSAAGTRTELDL